MSLHASTDSPASLSELQFAYSQFFLYDTAVGSPGCEWTEGHSRQGFARRAGVVSVGTVLEFGVGSVKVLFGPPVVEGFDRVIAVPLENKSGLLAIEGPEESRDVRSFRAPSGHYRATIAQRVIDEVREEITIWLEKVDVPVLRSEVLVADEDLDPPTPLIETANTP